MKLQIRAYVAEDIPRMMEIWNAVVADGQAFPQETYLTADTAAAFFAAQTYAAVAVTEDNLVGLYILHPNNVGRCGHIANASYAVDAACRGQHIGEALVQDCLIQAHSYSFSILQFNAVVKSNLLAIHLYEKLGFHRIGEIPNGFRNKNGIYENILLYYIAV